MTSWKITAAAAAALPFFIGASPALADVTAEQVWADWRDYMTSAGYEIRAEESRSGDTLTVSDLVMTFDIPEEDGTVTMTMGAFDFVDKGDGTVSIVLPPDLPIGVTVDGPGDEGADIGLNYATKGMSINASGVPDDLTYTYSAAMLAITLEELAVEGETVDMEAFGSAALEIADLAGSTKMQVGELRNSTQKLTTGKVSYEMDFTDPEGSEGHFVLRGGADGMDFRGSFAMPETLDTEEMAKMLRQGFSVDATFGYENGASEFNFKDGDEVVQGASSSEAGSLEVVMNEDRLSYDVSGTGMQMQMAGTELPFPVEFSMQETGFNFAMPVTATEEVQDFAFGLTLREFTMSDLIWGIFDPKGQLPRDPATVALDVTGKLKLLLDLMNPEDMEALESGEELPAEIRSLTLNELTVRAAGAELTGEGDFTFDNSDLETFEGLPAPEGSVNLVLKGGNALLDKLVEMGFVPEEEAGGMRMMMGLFAVPGEGEDTLTSTIEVKSDGQILANGQRIQ